MNILVCAAIVMISFLVGGWRVRVRIRRYIFVRRARLTHVDRSNVDLDLTHLSSAQRAERIDELDRLEGDQL